MNHSTIIYLFIQRTWYNEPITRSNIPHHDRVKKTVFGSPRQAMDVSARPGLNHRSQRELCMKPRVINLIIFLVIFCCSGLMPSALLSAADPETLVIQEAERGGYRLIEIDALKELYQNKADRILLVDTRQDWEYRSGYIKGAHHFPIEPTWFSRLIQRNALGLLLGPDRDKILIFY